MSKHKEFVRDFMHKFVSFSIYMLMGIVAIFIFYKALLLVIFVSVSMYRQIIEFPAIFSGDIEVSHLLGIKLAEQVLNVVTFLLVLVKSFKILKSYSLHHHISIKDLIEISIIALLMEVVFNFWLHPMGLNILFWVLWTTLVLVYATFPYFRK